MEIIKKQGGPTASLVEWLPHQFSPLLVLTKQEPDE